MIALVRPSLLYPVLGILFALDMFYMALFERSIIEFLLCFFTILLFEHVSIGVWFFTLLLLLAKHFVIHSMVGLPLLYIVPLILLTSAIKKRIYAYNFIFAYISLLVSLGAEFVLIEHLHLGKNRLFYYTIYDIGVNMIVMAVLLKCWSKGRQGNRF